MRLWRLAHSGQQLLQNSQFCVWRRLYTFIISSFPSRCILFPTAPSQGRVYDRKDPRARYAWGNERWLLRSLNHVPSLKYLSISCAPQGPKIPSLSLCILGECDFLLISSELWTSFNFSPRSTYSYHVKFNIFLFSSKECLWAPIPIHPSHPLSLELSFWIPPLLHTSSWPDLFRRDNDIILHL